MDIRLAGFNVDIENIKNVKKVIATYPDIDKNAFESLKKTEWTPEVISASYARISRDPRSIYKLREEASLEVEKARKSNKTIIFDMGHSSIAEHAVFNIDIVGISRLASEYIEKSRLVSFTEKSQRYIKIGKDNLIPEEYSSDKEFLNKYKKLLEDLFDSYEVIHNKLVEKIKKENPDIAETDKKYRDLINLAKEDARYILPLSTLTQLGMTINARNLEKMIRKLASSKIIELNNIARNLFEIVSAYTPSLVKYTTPNDFEKKDYSFLDDIINEREDKKTKSVNFVKLIEMDNTIEDKILAGFFVKHSTLNYEQAKSKVKKLTNREKEVIFKEILKDINFYDAVQREFELSNIEFNITLSASAFAQLKRHRMATIIDGRYSPSLGVTVPESLIKAGLKSLFMDKIGKIEELYSEAKDKFGPSSDYILSNAHRKNIVLKCNLRELVHIFRLRLDEHAQWDIRDIAAKMLAEVKPKIRFIENILTGKDSFVKF